MGLGSNGLHDFSRDGPRWQVIAGHARKQNQFELGGVYLGVLQRLAQGRGTHGAGVVISKGVTTVIPALVTAGILAGFQHHVSHRSRGRQIHSSAEYS